MAVWDPLGGGETHIDVVLSQISVDWPNEEFVGNILFPQVLVNKISDKYYVFNRKWWHLPPEGDLRAPGSIANEVEGRTVSTDTYYTQEHALQMAIPDEERENTDAFDSDRDATEMLTFHIMLGRELAMHSLVTTAANYATTHTVTLAGNDQWDSGDVAADPIGDFRTARTALHSWIHREPTLAVIPYEVMVELEDHPDFVERIKYVMVGATSEDLIARLLRIQRIVVPGVGYNSANPGQSESIGYLWGKDVVIAYVPPRAGIRIPAFAYEFVQRIAGRPMVVDRWREGVRVSDLVRVRRRYDLKIVAKDGDHVTGDAVGAYLIKAAVS
jgi:hypothetical protein